MEGETELSQGTTADPEGGGVGREEALQSTAESTTSPASEVPPTSKIRTHTSNRSHQSHFQGGPTTLFSSRPKTAHLPYPLFQTVPGQGPAFYQPLPPSFNPQPSIVPGSVPPPSYNGSRFIEIPLEAEQRQQPPKDYLVESFLVMVFCCLVIGVFALIYSSEARTAVAQGDLSLASIFSQKARSFVLCSLAFGLLTSTCWVIYILVFLYL